MIQRLMLSGEEEWHHSLRLPMCPLKLNSTFLKLESDSFFNAWKIDSQHCHEAIVFLAKWKMLSTIIYVQNRMYRINSWFFTFISNGACSVQSYLPTKHHSLLNNLFRRIDLQWIEKKVCFEAAVSHFWRKFRNFKFSFDDYYQLLKRIYLFNLKTRICIHRSSFNTIYYI